MSKPRILVAIPIKDSMHPYLKKNCMEHAAQLPKANPKFDLVFHYDYTEIPKEPTDCRPWSKVTRIRNKIIDSLNLGLYSHICWIDADIVDYNKDILTKLVDANPDGISAPLVLIEGTDKWYDWAAFVMKGCSGIKPDDRNRIWGRNLQHPAPYWWIDGGRNPDRDPMTAPRDGVARKFEKGEDIIDVDSVGAMYVASADIYRTGVRHEDHPAFTDHFPICEAALKMGRRVIVNRTCKAYHAILPNYGEKWH